MPASGASAIPALEVIGDRVEPEGMLEGKVGLGGGGFRV
jgi:hypothetical protein